MVRDGKEVDWSYLLTHHTTSIEEQIEYVFFSVRHSSISVRVEDESLATLSIWTPSLTCSIPEWSFTM